MALLELPKWITEHIPEEISKSHIFRFQVRFPNDCVIEADVLGDLDINFDNLEEHLETIPAQYMYWSAIYSELRHAVAVLEMRVVRRRAVLTKHILESFKTKGIKLTDKQLQNLIDIDNVDRQEISTRMKAENLSRAQSLRLSDEDLAKEVEHAVKLESQKTLPYLEVQLAMQQLCTGKIYHMIEAIKMRSEHCRSLAGFKRQEKEQASRTT